MIFHSKALETQHFPVTFMMITNQFIFRVCSPFFQGYSNEHCLVSAAPITGFAVSVGSVQIGQPTCIDLTVDGGE